MARSQKIRTGDVRVEGLAELSRALKELGPEAQKELRDASKEVAGFVARDASEAANAIGGVAAKTAPSIKPTGGVSGAGVALGGAAYPFAGGAAWGSVHYTQFHKWLGHIGYFPYPQIKKDRDRIADTYTDAVNKVIEKRFPQ